MIRRLPPEVVNQIAAGEVVERPFSVVKELVENSLDAGATRVGVEIEEGGRGLVRITDDGGGFTPADLELAFVSHATSKLGSPDDLNHIASLGFRGEALASIGSVSRAVIRSRTPDDDAGHEVRCTGGDLGEVRPHGCPPGTVIEVRDLFYNMPARRQFLKAAHAERARIQEMLTRLALARLDVDFTLIADGREVLRLPADESLRERVGRAFGRQLGKQLLEVSRSSGDYRVEGLVVDPDGARRDGKLELLYVNGRCAKDRSTGMAIRQAYRAYLMHGRVPAYFLMLSLPPAEVDVNVHPTKAEVRFAQTRRVAGLLHDAVRGALERRGGEDAAARPGSAAAGASMPRAASGFPDLPADLFGRAAPPPDPPPPRSSRGGTSVVREGSEGVSSPNAPPLGSEPASHPASHPASAPDEPRRANPFPALQGRRFLQVLELYLVFETPAGMVVVDQHALHERVVYEQLARRAADRPTEIQRLLVPEVLELVPSDKAYLLEAREALAEEGFLIDDFGGDAVAVQGVPAVLARARPAALVESFLLGDGAGDARPRARDAIHERFHSMACRGAVMSGDRLGDAEIEALLETAATLEHPHNCPHGRPTVLTFSAGELERYFRRKV